MGEIFSYKEIRKSHEINTLIEHGNKVLKTLGFTEHFQKACCKSSRNRRHYPFKIGLL